MKIKNENIKISIDKIEQWEKNAREIKPKDFERLKRQISELGTYKPIIVEKRGTGYIAIGGNMRLQAYKALGHKKIWAVEIESASEAERIKINISDNDRAGFYVQDLLAAVLKENKIDGLLDYKVDLKFPAFSLSDVLDNAREETPGEDSAPALPEIAKTKPGDIYTLGDHRLICGDSTRPETLTRLLQGTMADICFTDPPYNVNYTGGAGAPKREGIRNDKMAASAFDDFLFAAMTQAVENTKGGIYTCMGYSGIGALRLAFEKAGGHFSTFIIWIKSSFTLGHADYHHQYEIILYGWPEAAKRHYFTPDRTKSDSWECLKGYKAEFDGKENKTTITLAGYILKLKGKAEGLIQKRKHKTDIWRYDKPRSSAEHPTMKPVALCEEAIVNSSKRGELVLDLFTGSGSTMIAAEKTGRKFAGAELDPKYCDVAVQRWQEFTGRKAALERRKK